MSDTHSFIHTSLFYKDVEPENLSIFLEHANNVRETEMYPKLDFTYHLFLSQKRACVQY